MIVAPTWRSKAYLQVLRERGIVLNTYMLLPGKEPKWDGPSLVSVHSGGKRIINFSPSESIQATLEKIPSKIVKMKSSDIESKESLSQIDRLSESVIIYSGVGGRILKQKTLNRGKRFLHVHGGYAPKHRGSTAFYYSLLEEGTFGITALWLDEQLDTGRIIARRKYTKFPSDIDLDRVLDPILRADLLSSIIQTRLKKGKYPSGVLRKSLRPAYHVIHPILKHVAMKRYFPNFFRV